METMVKKKKVVDRETVAKKKKKVKRNQNQNLPNEIIESNILTRLPVKTLIRFMSACKSWYSLISDPYFINIHLHHHQNNQINKSEKPNLLLVQGVTGGRQSCPMVMTDRCFPPEESWSSFINDIDDFPLGHAATVVGSCGGMVCVAAEDCFYHQHIMLWNPALRVSKVVASPEQVALRVSKVVASPEQVVEFSNHHCVGFGYHNQTNDCNVIIFSNQGLRIEDAQIYSLNLDSWRKINLGGASNQLFEDTRVYYVGVYVNCYPCGAYFWLADKCDYDQGRPYCIETRIISFHMGDEQFKEMILPYDTTWPRCYNIDIFLYKDSLAVLDTYYDESIGRDSRSCNFWMMKECHDPESWTKLYSFDIQRAYVMFRGVVENDLIQLLCGDHPILLCHPIIKDVSVVDIDNSRVNTMTCPKIISFWTKTKRVSSFTESLIGFTNLKGVHSTILI